ncbi:trypsin-like peptidase domain-containing protein [Streptomyces sp. NPDC048521]|uniref:VMAP-C domain-containing protein n=1 Tax=Streptomyces sp. NPDC048521 TaxID=3365566 RepID=UPI00371B1993
MSWFRRPAGEPPVVSVLRRDGGPAVGAAALLSPDRVLTCAHVVNDALGRAPRSTRRPDGEVVEVAFCQGERRVKAHVEVWVPERPRPGGTWHGDVCVLLLAEPAPPGAEPVVWADMAEGDDLRAWHGSGYQVTFADVEAKRLDDGLGFVDGALSGAAIGPGHSGGPLLRRADHRAVGLVAGELRPPAGPLQSGHVVRRAWGLPWQSIRAELTAAGADEVLAVCHGDRREPADALVGAELLTVLRELMPLPAERAEHARQLAADLGLDTPQDDSAPRPEELAELLLGTARALPTLSESLATRSRARPGHLDSLLRLGTAIPAAGLLSRHEYAVLAERLRTVVARDAGLPGRAAQAALRFTPLPPVLCTAALRPDQLDEAITALESYAYEPGPDGITRMPPLLHWAEFVAAGLTEAERDLRDWSDRVCARLGVHRAALAERRADAERWARSATPPVSRLLVRLTPESGSPDLLRCRLWQRTCDGSVRRLDTAAGDTPLTSAEAAELIRVGAERSYDPARSAPPAVDVEVTRAWLHLPVDQWDGGSPNEYLPSQPLGVSFQLTLLCPEMSRRVPDRDAHRRRRWGDGHRRSLVVDASCADGPRLARLLAGGSHYTTNHVVVNGSPEQREQMLNVCLALGVPVVLWDRDAEGHEHADRLAPLAPTGALTDLPERVREFRSRPERPSASPALVWDVGTWDGLATEGHGPQQIDPDEGVRAP